MSVGRGLYLQAVVVDEDIRRLQIAKEDCNKFDE
jgi:hypothetical protein